MNSAVIRPFGLHDIWLIRRLQRKGLSLAVEHKLTHPRQPLWTALTAPWPWAGAGIATFVFDEWISGKRLIGFVQLGKRAARPEADLMHLAPSQDDMPEAGTVWQNLLGHCAAAAATHGLQRLFASMPNGSQEQACLKAAGFSLYTKETIYRLAEIPAPGGTLVGFRQQRQQDSWALQRLYARNTPRVVQQVEGGLTGEAGSPLLSWWEPDSWQGIVWEPAGEVRGAVQVHVGRIGHWMRVWGVNTVSPRELRTLVEQGLRLIDTTNSGKVLPVYVTVRDYEDSLGTALVSLGFVPYTDRARFVRHTTGMVREPLAAQAAKMEARQEVPARTQGAQRTPTNGS